MRSLLLGTVENTLHTLFIPQNNPLDRCSPHFSDEKNLDLGKLNDLH